MAISYAKSQQENLVTILAHDDKNGRIVARLIEPELFEGELRTIAERCVKYWKKYDRAPGAHTADLFSNILEDKNNPKAKTYRGILRNMNLVAEDINPKYTIDDLRTTHRVQRMKDSILKGADLINAQQELAIGEVEELMGNMLRAREFEFDGGLKLSDIDVVVDYMANHYSEFRTGIEAFDHSDIVPSRGAVMLVLAPTGRGKTWCLIHLGKMALLTRKKVLHISLEMPREQVLMRYYQSLFSVSKKREDVEITKLHTDDYNRLNRVGKIITLKPRLVFRDANIRKELKAALEPFKKRRLHERLRVARFPPRGLTMDGLRAYLDGLEAVDGFVPDLICLDYIGIVATDSKNPRVSLGRAMEDFMAVLVERNMAGVTAQQVGRFGNEARMVRSMHVAEDVSLINTSDIAITYSQTDEEKTAGLARLFVDKARSEDDKFGVVITQTYKLGQFMLQSARLDKTYLNYLKKISPIEDDHTKDD